MMKGGSCGNFTGTEDDVKELYKTFDKDGDGQLSYDEMNQR